MKRAAKRARQKELRKQTMADERQRQELMAAEQARKEEERRKQEEQRAKAKQEREAAKQAGSRLSLCARADPVPGEPIQVKQEQTVAKAEPEYEVEDLVRLRVACTTVLDMFLRI